MGTYYVDNDVGATGGSGTQQDPYGIETAIAAASPGDVFYWRGGGEGDVFVGHSLDFNNGGTAAAPVRWIGTDDDWVPIPVGDTPHTGVDGNNGAYALVRMAADYQIIENVRICNALQGRHGGLDGLAVIAKGIMVRNCWAHDCGIGFASAAWGSVFAHCRSYDTWFGFETKHPATVCHSCMVNDTESHGFRIESGAALVACRAYDIGGCGIEFHLDSGNPIPLLVDHFSAYDCVDGIQINAHYGTNPNVFSVTNSIFDTCSGYAVNVTTPAGQLGMILNNASRNCTSGQVPTGRTGLINDGWTALSACPFVDAANGDLSLVRGTPVIGAALDGGDLGALQRKFARLPYPAIGI